MEIRELRAFVAVAESGGLSAAARQLHISQSALSQTVQSLERQLGVKLLERDHAGARPTDAGKVLLREARPLIVQHDRAVTLLAGPEAPAAVLRIGVPLEFPADVLPEGISWHALIGNPIVRRTWAVWNADSRRRDLAALVAVIECSHVVMRL